MRSTFLLFGYGSLVFAPERPDRVLGLSPARLPGYRRAFNKLSHARACPLADSFDAFDDVPALYRSEGLNWSLALGTVRDEHACIEGLALEYPEESREDVLRDTDVREGFAAHRKPLHNGYLRHELEIHLESEARAALVYLSNPDPRNRWYVPDEVSVELRAKVLINATPHTPQQDDARGLLYLEGVRGKLAGAGIVDPELEALAAAVLSFDGPWAALVAAPRRLAAGFGR